MPKNEGNNDRNSTRLRDGYQGATKENRGHQPGRTLEEGYQPSWPAKRPTVAPKVGTTAVRRVVSTTNGSNKK
jgi:hypothetical protein